MSNPGKILLQGNTKLKAIPIEVTTPDGWLALSGRFSEPARTWAKAHGFSGESGRHLIFADAAGSISRVVVGAAEDPLAVGRLARLMPQGVYRYTSGIADARLAALAWCLEAYAFETYGKTAAPAARLVCPEGVDRDDVLRTAAAAWLARDLINTPASDLGPDELEAQVRKVARGFRVGVKVTRGAALQRQFPMIHHVGKASPRAPRLLDMSWGPARAPKVTLVGKGVVFDTGGLDIKPAAGMLLMKKDMGGAANILGLAAMIMGARLPVRLRVLIPVVENAISGNAFRPGDVLRSRKGLTVEIGNTDAEGRLILADALALADEESPDLLIDMATLTGAARVALGPDLAPFYTTDESVAAALQKVAAAESDPVWRMPFWEPYGRLFESSIADINNSGESGFAGSITAALFLKRFVVKARTYIHFDIFAWTPQPRAGRPKGGEAQGQRALFALIRERYMKPLAPH